MIYSIINSCKMRTGRILLSCLLIITTLITFSSCTTTESSYVRAGSYDEGSQSRIIKIILKNGIVINCEDKHVKIEDNYDMTSSFVISTAEITNGGVINWKEQRIPGTDIQRILIEEEKTDATKSILIISGIVIVAAIVFFVLVAVGFSDSMNAMTKKF